MFTGIIQHCVRVNSVDRKEGLTSFSVECPPDFNSGLKNGASVAVDGVCLTVVDKQENKLRFDAMAETLQRTTLGRLTENRLVNIERSATFSDEIGGHLVSGHVTGTAKIIRVDRTPNNQVVFFTLPTEYLKYIFPKGFIALDGASLTIVNVDRATSTFSVHLIPETLRRTTFGFKTTGDFVNFEIDSRTQTIVDTIEMLYQQKIIPNTEKL